MDTALKEIHGELNQLVARKAELEAKSDALRQELNAIDSTLRSLRKIILRVNGSVAQSEGHDEIAEDTEKAETNGKPRVRGHITTAIVDFIRKNPGVSRLDVANAIEDEITSASDDPRRVIMNSVLNLHRKGILDRGDDGRYTLSEN